MNKKLLLIPLFFIFSLFFVNAGIDCNLSIPNTNRIGNNTILNITFNVSADGSTGNMTVDVQAQSASTRNSTYANIDLNGTGNTSQLRHFNITFRNAIVLEDSNDYSFRAFCYMNNTQAFGTNEYGGVSSAVADVLVDRHRPAPVAAITFTNPVKTDNTITATLNRELANRCWIRFGGPLVPRRAMTLSGSTCTFTVGRDNPPNSDYPAFIESDDRTNVTLSTQQSITILGSTSDGGGILSGATIEIPQSKGGQSILKGQQSNPFAPKKQDKDNWVIWAVGAFLVFLYFKGKK